MDRHRTKIAERLILNHSGPTPDRVPVLINHRWLSIQRMLDQTGFVDSLSVTRVVGRLYLRSQSLTDVLDEWAHHEILTPPLGATHWMT